MDELDVEVAIQIRVFVKEMMRDPQFLTELRNLLLKDVRAKGDLYGPRYSKPPVANASLIQPVAPNRIQ